MAQLPQERLIDELRRAFPLHVELYGMSDFEAQDKRFYDQHPDLYHIAYACHKNEPWGRALWPALSQKQQGHIKQHRERIKAAEKRA